MSRKSTSASPSPKLISLAVASCFAAGPVLANPTGATVVNGQVTINQAGNLLSIANSPNSIINWQSFSVGANEITRFTQQSAASAVLNRVVGAGGPIDPSVILGALQSNGRVFLINPAGIVFGPGSQIDVAGLVASSLNLSNADFLGGRLRFTEVAGAGSVVNQGSINAASGGQVYLVGPSVTNSGIITSPKGEVILAAGNSVELVNPGTPNLRVEITAPDNEAKNLGSIVADAGRIGIYAGLINHSGTARADSAVATEDGRIVLKATRNTTVEAGSILSANGPSGGQVTIQSGDTTVVRGAISATGNAGKGGSVKVLGNLVGLDDGASIDVSGETGGGTALVGGGFQGKDPAVQNASRTYFGPNATIRADALGSGDGGTVVVWSDNVTGAYGAISARGGSQSGNGGLVEVSSHGLLDFQARVDTSAPNGRTGTLLLDPVDVCIYNTNSALCASGGVGSFFSGGMASVFTSSGGTLSVLQWGTIMSELGSNNVFVTTSNGSVTGAGDITIAEDSPNLNTTHLLGFAASRDMNVNGRIWNTNTGDLRIFAGWDEGATPASALAADPFGPVATVLGVGNVNVNAHVDMHGNVLMRAGNNITATAQINGGNFSSGNWSVVLDAGNALQVSSIVQVDGGSNGTATLGLSAGAGGILVDGGHLIAAEHCCNGGSAAVSLSTPGPVTLQNTTVDVTGGEGRGFPAGPGGNATFTVSAGGPLSISNSTINVTGGVGGHGDGAEGLGGTGGMGGTAGMNLGAGSISIGSSTLRVFGGQGGQGGSASSVGGTGGRGGDALFTMNTGGPVTLTGTSIQVAGGRGGSGGSAFFVGGTGGRGGDGIFTASAGSLSLESTSINVSGGGGGDGSSARFTGGAGGDGGNAVFTVNGGAVSLNSSSIFVSGGGGGRGSGVFASSEMSAFTATSGPGGRGGDAVFTMNSGPVTMTGNSSIDVSGGFGGSGGGFEFSGSRAAGRGFALFGGRGGDGGNAQLLISAQGPVALSGASSIFVFGGGGGYGGSGFSAGRGGIGGNGGAADSIIGGPSVSLTGSSIGVGGGFGGDGGYGSFGAGGGTGGNGGGATSGVLSNVVGGSVALNGSEIRVSGGVGGFGGSAGSSASSPPALGGNGGNGGTAAGSITATTISMTGSQFVVQGGGPGGPGFGDAGPGVIGQGGNATAVLSAGGNINLQTSTVSAENGVGAEGGPSGGGTAAVAITANGAITIGNASKVTALANVGTPTVASGSPASVLISSLADVSLTDSMIGSVGGTGIVSGGSAVTQVNALGGGLVIQGTPGTFNNAVVAWGGLATGAGGIGGTGELNLASSGTASIRSSAVAAFGGDATQGIGGKATFNAVTPGELSIQTSSVGAFGGFGAQRGGNAGTNVVAGNIRVEGTGGSPITPYISKIMAALQPSGHAPISEVTTLLAVGGRTLIGGVPGGANVQIGVIGPDGTVTLLNDSIQAIGGGVTDPATGRPIGIFGPSEMFLVFLDRTSGGIFVNGLEGPLSVGSFTVTPDGFVQGSGFFQNGAEATNIVSYLGRATPEGLPVTFDSQTIASLVTLADTLTPQRESDSMSGPNKDEKKKKQAECR